jgi:four helix bundle protein
MESYRDLIAWQKGMDLVVAVYAASQKLPDSERFGLISQLRRAAVCVPSALAEGHARSATKEFVRYVSIAMGSLAEVETQLMICTRLDMLEDDTMKPILQLCDEQNRILRGLKKSLTARLGSNSPLAPRPSPL